MASKTVKVGSAVGLHARPAALIADKAAEFDKVTLSVGGSDPIDASSALLIMTLGAEYGAEVTVSSKSKEAVETIAQLISQDLDS